MSRRRLPVGSKVAFDIAQGLDTGKAVIVGREQDEDDGHWLYKLDVIEGSKADLHRDKNGELWVNDFEVRPIR